MTRDLAAFHVMPLLPGREAELAGDAARLLESGVCTHVACIMTLVPRATAGRQGADPGRTLPPFSPRRSPAMPRASASSPRRPSATAGSRRAGRLFQKSSGPMAPRLIRCARSDTASGSTIRGAFRCLAALRPAFFMIDDDFRLLTGRNGCYCPLHLAAAGERLGRGFTRGTLLDTLRRDPAVARAYDALLLDSLMRLAEDIRGAIDAADPAIPGSFCACYGDIRHAEPLARRLAGAAGRPLVRINNARYLCGEMRTFPVRMYRARRRSLASLPTFAILAETDPCPHNPLQHGGAA